MQLNSLPLLCFLTQRGTISFKYAANAFPIFGSVRLPPSQTMTTYGSSWRVALIYLPYQCYMILMRRYHALEENGGRKLNWATCSYTEGMKMFNLRMLIVFMCLVPAVETRSDTMPKLIPQPCKLIRMKGAFSPAVDLCVMAASGEKGTAQTAETLVSDLRETGFNATVSKDAKAAGIILKIINDKSLGDEGYRLKVGEEIIITAYKQDGLFWGTRTVLQLLETGQKTTIPMLLIEDKPRYRYRGCMVDVARWFHSLKFHQRMIKNLSRYKINFYHIHFSDDQSFTLPSEHYPSLPSQKRCYTKQELDELVNLAERYHVTIIPEIDIPGHATTLCAAVPELVCRGKPPGGVICAGSEKSYAALEALVSETMDIFPGPYFHIGADEVNFAAWDGCPDCAEMIKKEKLKDNHGLYNYFINRINRFVKSKGRRTIVWEGFKPGTTPFVDKDIIVDQFENHYAMPDELIQAGYDLINASWAPLYIARNMSTPAEQIAEWNPTYFGKHPPPKPLTDMVHIQDTKQLLGACMCTWENPESVEDGLLFGIGEPVPGYSQPEPRLPIFAGRVWIGNGHPK